MIYKIELGSADLQKSALTALEKRMETSVKNYNSITKEMSQLSPLLEKLFTILFLVIFKPHCRISQSTTQLKVKLLASHKKDDSRLFARKAASLLSALFFFFKS
jgi:hypothetical protein